MEELPLDMEAVIESCVEEFHMRAYGDPVLGRMFVEAVPNVAEHLRRVCDFWSHVLLASGRYSGAPYSAHAGLALEPEHLDRWMGHFREAVRRTMPEDYAERAIAKADQILAGLRSGLSATPFTARV
jgi:hemoglobin